MTMFRYLPLFLLLCFLAGCNTYEKNRLQPYTGNTFYWQYHGKPVMLLGASKDDNLFQQTGLKSHLDEIKDAGGNYIRNTMSGRDVGGGNEVRAWLQDADGRYNLNRPNPEYWNRFDSLLRWTHEREIFVQVEVWATHDLFGAEWLNSPWNPVNNNNYRPGQTILEPVAPERAYQPHPFFATVPGAKSDTVVLEYQQKFVWEMMRRTLEFDHVLYCMTNEIQHAQPAAWSWYWAKFLKETALEAGKNIEVTEMYWAPDLKDDQHKRSLDHPEIFTFFESSQNSAKSGRENWDNLQFVRTFLADNPRPINSVKVYGKTDSLVRWPGTDEEAVDRFWRNIMGGCASTRFHRNENGVYGLGLCHLTRQSLSAARAFTNQFPPWEASPAMHLLKSGTDEMSQSDHTENTSQNIAYLAEIPGYAISVYFTQAAPIELDLSDYEKNLVVLWTNILTGQQQEEKSMASQPETPENGDKTLRTQAPGEGGKALQTRASGSKAIQGEAPDEGNILLLEPPGEGKWLAVIKQAP